MSGAFRRIITGRRADGKSYLEAQGAPTLDVTIYETRLVRGWVSGEGAELYGAVEANDAIAVPLQPLNGGSKAGFFQILPDVAAKTLEQIEREQSELYARLGASHSRVPGSRHPAMHWTQTIDYIFVLSGEVTLMLDEDDVALRPFDLVVQRQTNHAWINKGVEPCLLAYVMIDATPLS
jgi:hypothetical protein